MWQKSVWSLRKILMKPSKLGRNCITCSVYLRAQGLFIWLLALLRGLCSGRPVTPLQQCSKCDPRAQIVACLTVTLPRPTSKEHWKITSTYYISRGSLVGSNGWIFFAEATKENWKTRTVPSCQMRQPRSVGSLCSIFPGGTLLFVPMPQKYLPVARACSN